MAFGRDGVSISTSIVDLADVIRNGGQSDTGSMRLNSNRIKHEQTKHLRPWSLALAIIVH